MSTIAETFDEHWLEDAETGCWIWQRARASRDAMLAPDRGYGCLKVAGKVVTAHKFAYEREYGPVKAGLQIRHQCHRTLCVNPSHMLLGTNQQNVQDRIDAGRYAKKLTAEDIRTIRARCKSGETQQAVGADFRLHQACVSNIVNRKYWVHVE